MPLTETDDVKDRLLSERDRLVNDIGGLDGQEPVESAPSNHPAEVAADLSESAMNGTLRQFKARQLAMVEDALRRLETGTYGVCDECGEEIAPARLDAIPHAKLCVECQGRLESNGR